MIIASYKEEQPSSPVAESTLPQPSTIPVQPATSRAQDSWSHHRSGSRQSSLNNQSGGGTSSSSGKPSSFSDNNNSGGGAGCNYTSLKTGAVSRRPTNLHQNSVDSNPSELPDIDDHPSTIGNNSATPNAFTPSSTAKSPINPVAAVTSSTGIIGSKPTNIARSMNKSTRMMQSSGQDRSKMSSDVNTTIPWTIQTEKERSIDPINRRNSGLYIIVIYYFLIIPPNMIIFLYFFIEKERRMKDSNFTDDIRDRKNDTKQMYKSKNDRKFDSLKNQDDIRPKYVNQNSYTRNDDRPKYTTQRESRESRNEVLKYQDTRASTWQNPSSDLSTGEWGSITDNSINVNVTPKSKCPSPQYEDKLEKWSSNESLSKSPRPITPVKTIPSKPVDTSKMAKLNSKDTPIAEPVVVDTTTRDAPLPATNVWKSRSDEKQRLKDEEESRMRAAHEEARMNHRNNQQHRQPNNNSSDINYHGPNPNRNNIYDQDYRRYEDNTYRRNDNRDFRLDDNRGFRSNENRFNNRNNRIDTDFPYRDIRETQRPMRDQRNSRSSRYDNENSRDYSNEPYTRENNYRENRGYNRSSRDFRLDEKNNQRNEDKNRKDMFSEERIIDDRRIKDTQNEDRIRPDNEISRMDQQLVNEDSEEKNQGDQRIEKKPLKSQVSKDDIPVIDQLASDKHFQRNDDRPANQRRNSNRQRNNEPIVRENRQQREPKNDWHTHEVRNGPRPLKEPGNIRFLRDYRPDDRQVWDKRNDDLKQNRDQRNDDQRNDDRKNRDAEIENCHSNDQRNEERPNKEQRNDDRQNRDIRNDNRQNRDQRNDNRPNRDQRNDDRQNRDQRNENRVNRDQRIENRQNRDQRNDDRQNRDQRNDDRQNRDQRNDDRQNRDQRNDDRQNKDQRNDDRQNRDQRQGEHVNRELRHEEQRFTRNQKYEDRQQKFSSNQTYSNHRDNDNYQKDGNRQWDSGNQRVQPQRDERRDGNPRNITRRDERPTQQPYQAKGTEPFNDTKRKNPDIPREGRRKFDNRKGSNNSDEQANNIKNVRIPSNSSDIATEDDKLRKKHKDITVRNLIIIFIISMFTLIGTISSFISDKIENENTK